MLTEDNYKAVLEMFELERVTQPGLTAPRKLSEVFQGALCNLSHFVSNNQPLAMDSESTSNLVLMHGLMQSRH